jgi:hypothetical protein
MLYRTSRSYKWTPYDWAMAAFLALIGIGTAIWLFDLFVGIN